jgi:putative DNA primase/helicase
MRASVVVPLTATSPILDAALDYARAGLCVFPLNGKKPLTAHGFKNATCAESTIREWWRKTPRANVGLPTGAMNGLIVIDVDGPGGDAALAALEANNANLPPTRKIQTRPGRHQLWFKQPPGFISQCSVGALGTNLDVRGDGGYVCAPPSIHPESNKPYTVVNDLPWADLPPWLLTLVKAQESASAVPNRPTIQRAPVTGQTRFEELCAELRAMAPNSGRNNLLNKIAFWLGQAAALGMLSATGTLDSLRAAAIVSGLTMSEVDNTIKSGYQAGLVQPQPYEFNNDMQNALRLALLHGQNLRHCEPMKKWFVWDGKRFGDEDRHQVLTLMTETVRAMAAEIMLMPTVTKEDQARRNQFIKHVAVSGNASRIESAIRLARGIRDLTVVPAELDTDPVVLNCLNGTLNLTTSKLMTHRRSDLITMLAPVNFYPESRSEIFGTFMNDIFEGKRDLMEWVKCAFGYCSTGLMTEQVFFLFLGDGENGKSRLLQTISAAMGDYATPAPEGTFLVKQGDSSTADLASLRGARLVTAIEPDDQRRLAESRIKYLTGEDETKARLLYENFQRLKLCCKVVIATNELEIQGRGHSTWRRVKTVPMNWRVPADRRDRQLGEKLLRNTEAVLTWIAEGAAAWFQAGQLGDTPEVTKATLAYRDDTDFMGEFLEGNIEKFLGGRINHSRLVGALKRFAKEQNYVGKITPQRLRKYLLDKGFTGEPGAHNVWFWTSVRWRGDGL